MSIQTRRRFLIREKMLDYSMLFFSLVAIIGSIAMILISSIWLKIVKPTPYLLYTFLILLGFLGIRNFQREIEE